MRRMNVLIVLCILASVLPAQSKNDNAGETAPPGDTVANLTPLNVKTGLWQMSETITWVGLPPQMAGAMDNGHTVNYKSCVKPEDLSSNPWAQGSGHVCRWTGVRSNGTDMVLQGESCDLGEALGMSANVKGTIHVIDSQDGTGTFDVVLTGNGKTMHGHASYTGRWVSPTCSDQMN